jgi:hypothetical protein
MLFLNSLRYDSYSKQQWHSREAQIELLLIECECEWAFRVRALEIYIGKLENPNFTLTTLLGDWLTNTYLPLHIFPSPEYPTRHSQRYDPLVLIQTAFAWHLWIPREHSSISEIIKIFLFNIPAFLNDILEQLQRKELALLSGQDRKLYMILVEKLEISNWRRSRHTQGSGNRMQTEVRKNLGPRINGKKKDSEILLLLKIHFRYDSWKGIGRTSGQAIYW